MPNNNKVKRPLTADELAHVMQVIADADTSSGVLVGGIVATFTALMGGTEAWEAAESIDPTDYAIPREQSVEICQAMMDKVEAQNDGLYAVNVALDWMNKGPSSYEEGEE